MKIKIKKYDYKTIDNKVTRTEIKRNWLYQMLINIILFFFKIINFRHTYSKDEYDKLVMKEILDIRGLRTCAYEGIGGLRTCAYEGIGGQIYISQFLFKIGKYYI